MRNNIDYLSFWGWTTGDHGRDSRQAMTPDTNKAFAVESMGVWAEIDKEKDETGYKM